MKNHNAFRFINLKNWNIKTTHLFQIHKYEYSLYQIQRHIATSRTQSLDIRSTYEMLGFHTKFTPFIHYGRNTDKDIS